MDPMGAWDLFVDFFLNGRQTRKETNLPPDRPHSQGRLAPDRNLMIRRRVSCEHGMFMTFTGFFFPNGWKPENHPDRKG